MVAGPQPGRRWQPASSKPSVHRHPRPGSLTHATCAQT